MKITEVSADGLGVSTLIAAAGKIHDLTEERNITLGVVEDADTGSYTACVIADQDVGKAFALAVTVERNPKIVTWALQEDGDRPEGP